MRRRFLLWFISLAAVSIIVVSCLLIWLLGTNEGAQWAFTRLSRSLPVAVTIEKFEGSLAGNLKIAGVHIRHSEWTMDIDTGDISWHPLELVFGHAGFDNLYLRKVTFTDIRPGDQPLDLSWPVMPPFLAKFWGGVTAFQVNDFVYSKGKKELIRIDRLRAGLKWRFGTLTASDIDIDAPLGRAAGTIGAGFDRPNLFGDVLLMPRHEVAGYDQIRIALKPTGTVSPEHVASVLNFTACKEKKDCLTAVGRVGLKRDSLLFQELKITEKERKGTVVSKGEIIVSGPEVMADLQLRGEDINPIKGDTSVLSGTINVKGTFKKYDGRFAVELRDPKRPWVSGHLGGSIQGREQGVSIPVITGEWLGGSLSGNLDLGFGHERRLAWTFKGRELHPEKINREWQGQVNINAVGSILWDGNLPAHGSLSLTLVDSIVWGKSLNGDLAARWEKGNIYIDQSHFQGRGFLVDAHGRPEDGIRYDARITDLSVLVPGGSGRFSGGGWIRWKKGQWAGVIKGDGPFTWTKNGVAITCTKADARWEGSEKGVHSSWNLALDQSGSLDGSFSSNLAAPAFFAFPVPGQFRLSWRAVDVRPFKVLWGDSVDFRGRLNGKIEGTLLPNDAFEVGGSVDLPEGKISNKSDRGVIATAIRRSVMDFNWKGASLEGKFTLGLGSRGKAAGGFQLPVPAHFPLKMNEDGRIDLQANGEIQEKGLLSSLFAGLVKESRGHIQFNTHIAGTWKYPKLSGTVKLDGAGAQFPRAGIRLDDAKAEAELVQDQIKIKTFHARLGGADLSGSATVWLKNWAISHYEGVLSGDHVQTVYTPEIHLWTSPDLRFSGTMKRLVLRGTINIPEAQIRYAEAEGVVRASRDVVIVDLPKKNKDSSPITFDAQVAVVLGDKVFVDASGFHARLGGRVVLSGQSLEKVLVDGQIDVLKGYYERYGVKLDVVRGRAVFKVESAERGNLDILAIKKVRDKQRDLDVEAGVTVTGNVQSPLVKLYGRPAMDDRDVIAYMVIGQPYQTDSGGSQKDQIAQWAAAILKGTPSSSFPRRLQEKLGIDTVGVEAGSTGGVAKSIVTIGKYLSPDLYVAFGRSLFGDDYYISTRYSFLKHWQIESKVGLQTGTDVFYKIEFE
ncbi:MAG: hypothetical protein CSYNP_03854 [Syntrophus sp. SKADARSKE-3]|nr:hypothetical protein [Syntrophus sp. SKADARSKE-3]